MANPTNEQLDHAGRAVLLAATANEAETETFKNLVSIYESDFGVCRVLLCRAVPPGTVMLLDSSRIDVLPLAGRSFHYRPLASVGDRESGQILGEYTLEFRNENAHAVLQGLASAAD